MARFDLRLPDSEIGRLNLKEFDALVKRKRTADNHARLNVGIIAAAVYNCAPFGDGNRKVINPVDFVPDWKQPEADLRQMTPEEQKRYLMNMFYHRR